MRPFIFALFSVMLTLLVGLWGRWRRLGFAGSFVVSLLITPVLAFLLLYVTEPTRTRPVAPLPPGRSRP